MDKTLTDHLFGPGPKQILALCGGGTRGIITLAYLEKIEALLAEKTGRGTAFRLSDYYDLIGGTSVGSMIATQLALGASVQHIRERFMNWAPHIFKRSFGRLPFIHPKFNSTALKRAIHDVVGEDTLSSQHLKTGLAIMIKRLDTGSPWIMTNNSNSKYWNTPDDKSFIGNRHYKLANLVQASTSAPYFFAPKAFSVIEGQVPGIFVDGGVSPHNNPSMQLLMLASIKGYGFNWTLGPDTLSITSIGTGMSRFRMAPGSTRGIMAGLLGVKSLQGLMADNDLHTLTLMQWLSRSPHPWTINSEIGDLRDDFLSAGQSLATPLLSFQHYDIALENDWLKNELNIEVSENALEAMRAMDNPDSLQDNYDIALKAADLKVRHEDFVV